MKDFGAHLPLAIDYYHHLLFPLPYVKEAANQGNLHQYRIALIHLSYTLEYLKALICRLAYFIFSGLTQYPSDRFVFEQFKNYNFKEMTKSQSASAYKLFSYFLKSNQFDSSELNQICQQLDIVATGVEDGVGVSCSSFQSQAFLAKDLLSQLSQLSQSIEHSSLNNKLENYTAKKESESDCDVYSYRNIHEDQRSLSQLHQLIGQWLNGFNQYRTIANSITQEMQVQLKRELLNSSSKLESICAFLHDLYVEPSCGDENWIHQIQNTESLLHSQEWIDEFLKEFKDGNFQHLNIDSEWLHQLEEMGKAGMKRLARGLLYNIAFYPLKGSDQLEDVQWKIERYEEILQTIQQVVMGYLQEHSLSAKDILARCQSQQALVWEQKVRPFLESLLSYQPQSVLSRFNRAYLNQIRQTYNQGVIDHLRQAAKWAKENEVKEKGAEHIDAICHALYTQVNLNSYCQKVLKNLRESDKVILNSPSVNVSMESPSVSSPLVRNVKSIHQQINATLLSSKIPRIKNLLNNAIGHLNGISWLKVVFDPNKQANPIHVFSEKILTINQQATVIIKNIAMGTPTIEQGEQVAEINEEFLGFLRTLKRKQQKHLYVNYQNFIPKSWILGNEAIRCRAIQSLMEKAFKGTFYTLTLTKNSSFYYQKEKEKEAVTFKQELMDELFNRQPSLEQLQQLFSIDEMKHNLKDTGHVLSENQNVYDSNNWNQEMRDWMHASVTGCHISYELREQLDLINWMSQTFDHMHELLVGSKPKLERQERRFFIDLSYAFLVFKILFGLKPYSYNQSCKDRADRAAEAEAFADADIIYLNDQEQNTEIWNYFESLIFVRAIMIKKRAPIEERTDNLTNSVEFLHQHKSAYQTLFKRVFPNVQFHLQPL